MVQSQVVPAVSVTAHPGNVIVQGESVTFTATLDNTVMDPTYPWYVDGELDDWASLMAPAPCG